jgi:hypothetical protein
MVSMRTYMTYESFIASQCISVAWSTALNAHGLILESC